jgi:hypothetical protein
LARFEAEAKERLCMVARRFGRPRAFAADFFEIHESPVEIARQIAHLRSLEVAEGDEAALRQRIGALRMPWKLSYIGSGLRTSISPPHRRRSASSPKAEVARFVCTAKRAC